MVLRRSNSNQTTLSTVKRRKSKYQYLLSIFNVLILLTSLLMLVFGIGLKAFYKLDSFDFLSNDFVVLPYFLIIVGGLMFLTSAVSFVGFRSEAIMPYMVIAGLMAVFSLAMLGGSFFCLNLSKDVKVIFGPTKNELVNNAKKLYKTDEGFRANYNMIQQKFRCCGFDFFKDMSQGNSLKYCCIPDEENKLDCEVDGESKFEDLFKQIYNEGCFNVVERKLKNTLPTMLIIGSLGMAATAIIGIVNVALAFAFVAQIKRKNKDWDLPTLPQNNFERNEDL